MTNSLVISDINPRYARHILQLALVFQNGIPAERVDWMDGIESLQALVEFMQMQLPEGENAGGVAYYNAVSDVLEASRGTLASVYRASK